MKLLEDDIVLGLAEDLDGQEEALEAEDADMAGIEGVSAEAREEFRRGVVFEKASSG